jgi:hypothetical protein
MNRFRSGLSAGFVLIALAGVARAQENTAVLEQILGNWLEQGYVETLVKTRSPLQALKTAHQKGIHSVALRLEKDAEGYVWAATGDFHEGIPYSVDGLRSLGKNTYEPILTKRNMEETGNRIVFPDGSKDALAWMFASGGKQHRLRFFRINDRFVNQAVLAGAYTDQGGRVFVFDGVDKAVWPDKSFAYTICLDTGFTQTDCIFVPEEKVGNRYRTYVFEWKEGKLYIYDIKGNGDEIQRADTPLYVLSSRK